MFECCTECAGSSGDGYAPRADRAGGSQHPVKQFEAGADVGGGVDVVHGVVLGADDEGVGVFGDHCRVGFVVGIAAFEESYHEHSNGLVDHDQGEQFFGEQTWSSEPGNLCNEISQPRPEELA